jgi:hypothetical protein
MGIKREGGMGGKKGNIFPPIRSPGIANFLPCPIAGMNTYVLSSKIFNKIFLETGTSFRKSRPTTKE